MDPSNIDKEDLLLPERPDEHKKNESPIRTFSTDLAQAVRKDEMTVIKVAMAEQKRRAQEEEQYSPRSKKNRTFLTIGIILILITIIGVVVIYFVKKNRLPEIVPAEVVIPSLINTEVTTNIEVGGLGEGKIVELTRATMGNVSGTDGQIANIYFTDSRDGTKKLISTNSFLASIKSEVPEPLTRTLLNNFMLGIYTKNNATHPFLILKTNDFQIAFANMYIWERKLFSDFYLSFNLPGDEEAFTNKFSDQLVENKSTRTLKRDDGTIILMYGFANDYTIVIADSVETYKEILRRLQTIR